MTTLAFTLTFATNVRFGTGRAQRGLDEVIDREAPLSEGALKGVLRDEARWLLPHANGDHPFVSSVFGNGADSRCPWHFDTFVEEVDYTPRAGLKLDPSGRVVPGALLVKEEASIPMARLEVRQRGALPSTGLPDALKPQAAECHAALLHLAARAAEKVGQRRTRGLGWVAFTLAAENARDVTGDLDLVWQIRDGGER